MRIDHLLETDEQLDEASLKQVAAAAAFLGAAIIPHSMDKQSFLDPSRVEFVKVLPDEGAREAKSAKSDLLVAAILSKYKTIDPLIAKQIVTVAKKHARPDFPRAEDILSVIGVESSFNHLAKSKLKKDPAKGLMQVRPGVWKISDSDLHHIEDQIKHGVKILSYYYDKLESREGALRAYNLGITRHLKNKNDPRGAVYVEKFKKEQQLYKD